MKCPKCGYNSFEGNDLCKKCSHDLTSHRLTYGLKPVVLQKETRAAMAASPTAESAPMAGAPQQPEQVADMFTFDLPQEPPAAPTRREPFPDEAFSFNEPPAHAPFSEAPRERAAAEPDPFADLLEPAQVGGRGAAPSTTADSTSPEATSTPGEYDLSDFSWDETAEPSSPDVKKPADDFNNLFGKVGQPARK